MAGMVVGSPDGMERPKLQLIMELGRLRACRVFGCHRGDVKPLTYCSGQVALPKDASPRILNKSWTITADVEVPEKAEGMVVTHGGLNDGYAHSLREGRPTFVSSYLTLERPTLVGKEPQTRGRVKLGVRFNYSGKTGEFGKGGTLKRFANGMPVTEGRLERTIPIQISPGEGLDVGMDDGSAVDLIYRPPLPLTGKIDKVKVELK